MNLEIPIADLILDLNNECTRRGAAAASMAEMNKQLQAKCEDWEKRYNIAISVDEKDATLLRKKLADTISALKKAHDALLFVKRHAVFSIGYRPLQVDPWEYVNTGINLADAALKNYK